MLAKDAGGSVKTESATECDAHFGPTRELCQQTFHCLQKSGTPTGVEIKECAVLVEGYEPGVKVVVTKVD
jgi:hypothetical protein